MYKAYCRIYQSILKMSSFFINFRKPELLEGINSIQRLPEVIKSKGIQRVLIVTGPHISSLGLMNPLLSGLKAEAVDFFVYDKTVANPTTTNIEEALKVYLSNGCDGIIAFGGGSPIDCAKVVACRVAKPQKTIAQMRGVLKVRRKLPPLIAIPTTSGSGSETTIAAVVTDPDAHEKYAINDPALIPLIAVLDPVITVGLPASITSTTGMDALTHAVEAYIGRSNTKETKDMALKAVKLIFDNLAPAYSDGNDLNARANLQKASFYAGVAFTRAYVGYVHAIAHAVGGIYGVPHGLANAVILPYVLEAYGTSAHKKLSELADAAGIAGGNDTNAQKAAKFIGAIRQMNTEMSIPDKIDGILEKDISMMAQRAFREGNPLYPVPRILNRKEIETIIEHVMK